MRRAAFDVFDVCDAFGVCDRGAIELCRSGERSPAHGHLLASGGATG